MRIERNRSRVSVPQIGQSSKPMPSVCLLALIGSLILPTVAWSEATPRTGFGGADGLGEYRLAAGDDESSEPIDLSSVFPGGIRLGGLVYDTLFVNINGSVSFDRPVRSYQPSSLSDTELPAMLAVWWNDIDTREASKLARNLISYGFDEEEHLFSATWLEVGAFNHGFTLTNTFQIVIEAGGRSGDADIELRYDRCQWAAANSNGGRSGRGGQGPVVGISLGYGRGATLLPGSGTDDALGLCSTSNAGEPGVWRFFLRDGEVEIPEPATTPPPIEVAQFEGVVPTGDQPDSPTRLGRRGQRAPRPRVDRGRRDHLTEVNEDASTNEQAPDSPESTVDTAPANMVGPPTTDTSPATSAGNTQRWVSVGVGESRDGVSMSRPAGERGTSERIPSAPAPQPYRPPETETPAAGPSTVIRTPPAPSGIGRVFELPRVETTQLPTAHPVNDAVTLSLADPSPSADRGGSTRPPAVGGGDNLVCDSDYGYTPIVEPDLDADGDQVPASEDCNDHDPDVFDLATFYGDEDGDGFGDPDVWIEVCMVEPPEGYVLDDSDQCPEEVGAEPCESVQPTVH